MIAVNFVCHGNICRSPMAEFLFKREIGLRGLSNQFVVESSATTFEAIGMAVHKKTAEILDRYKIDYSKKRAVHLEKSDYDKYDYIIVMDEDTIEGALDIFGGDKKNKVFKLMDFTKKPRDVADPWYTHDFQKTFKDIVEGIDGFLNYLSQKGLIEVKN